MPKWCPKCGAYGFAEYVDKRKIIKCLKCGYKEKLVYTSEKERVKRLIWLHAKELAELEKSLQIIEKIDLKFCRKCGTNLNEDKVCTNKFCSRKEFLSK